MNRSKNIGTAGESQVVKWFQANGFPYAKRITLHGAKDIGDVHLGDGIHIVVEVKAGRAAESASDGQIRAWLHELLDEMDNAGELHQEKQVGVLVVKRKGMGEAQVGGWWALTPYAHHEVVRWRLDEFVRHYLTPWTEQARRAAIRNSWDDDE